MSGGHWDYRHDALETIASDLEGCAVTDGGQLSAEDVAVAHMLAMWLRKVRNCIHSLDYFLSYDSGSWELRQDAIDLAHPMTLDVVKDKLAAARIAIEVLETRLGAE